MAQMNPTITLHGSDAESMVRDRIEAINALQDAIKALQPLAPHMRDYPGLDQFNHDRDIHWARIGTLNKLIDDLTGEGLAIRDKTL